MKKLLALMLSLLLVLGCFTACGTKEQTEEPAPSVSEKETPAVEEKPAEETPAEEIKEEPLQIKWVVQNTINVPFDSETESELKDLIEEKYNVEIILQQVDVHDLDSLGLYWAGGGDPDVITGTWQVWNTWADLIDEGFLRPIPEGYLETYMPDWMAGVYAQLGEENVKAQTSLKGETWIVAGQRMTIPYVMAIRQDWLDNLGITELPTNIEELYDLCYRFTYDDPDGNGVDDTYGLGGTYLMGYLSDYYNVVGGYTWNDDGSVTYNYVQENYKEFLKEANRWFEAGIVDPEFATNGDTETRDKFVAGTIGIQVDNMNYFTVEQNNSTLMRLREVSPDANVVVLAPFENKDGLQTAWCTTRVGTQSGALAFGANCSDEVMQRIMQIKNDLASDFEFYKRCYYGVEGVHYEIVDGKIVKFADIPEEDVDPLVGTAFAQGTPFQSAWYDDMYSAETVELYNLYTNDAIENWLQINQNFSLLKSNEAAGMYGNDIGTVAQEFQIKAILGEVDVETEWDAYVQDLYDLGLQQILDENEALLAE